MRPSALLRNAVALHLLLSSAVCYFFADTPYSWFYDRAHRAFPAEDPAFDRPGGVACRDRGLRYLADAPTLSPAARRRPAVAAASPSGAGNSTSRFGRNLLRSADPSAAADRHTPLAVAVQSVTRPDGAYYLAATVGSVLRSLRHVPPELYQLFVVNGNAVAGDHVRARKLAGSVPMLEYDPAELARVNAAFRTGSDEGGELPQQKNETAMYAHILDRLAPLCDYALVLEDDVVSDDSLADALVRILGPDFAGRGLDLDDWLFVKLYFTEQFLGFSEADVPLFVVFCSLCAIAADVLVLDRPSLLSFLTSRLTLRLTGKLVAVDRYDKRDLDSAEPADRLSEAKVHHTSARALPSLARHALPTNWPATPSASSWRTVYHAGFPWAPGFVRRLPTRVAAVAFFVYTIIAVPLMIGRQNIMLFPLGTPVYFPRVPDGVAPGKLVETSQGCCTQAMLYKSSAIPELVTYLLSDDVRTRLPVDVALDTFAFLRRRRTLLHFPSVFQHMGIRSTADDRPVPHMSASFEKRWI
ncbi:MAG: hypothetical protein BJ554DRAFT_5983 [Olpidium bornovanus]|uniref:Uncharacterized protein n=1 Tax=Olpidium bornovanus TaxID=278681 RepID=A0A8H8DKD6_9FUNG|nr:MAG: hypothetical protein BJ554DRAFT_5983 [Olpidium bornovanus]